MAKFKWPSKKTNPFDEAIDGLFEARKTTTVGSPERAKIDAEIMKLSEAKDKARDPKPENKWIGPVIGGAFGLAQIIVVTHYEELHCLTSKAVNFITKPKL